MGPRPRPPDCCEVEVDDAPLNDVGSRSIVIDSEGRHVAVIEITSVRVISLGDVDLAHVLDEGEGLVSVGEWRAAHEQGWHSPEERAELGDPEFTVDDETPVVLQRFRLIEKIL